MSIFWGSGLFLVEFPLSARSLSLLCDLVQPPWPSDSPCLLLWARLHVALALTTGHCLICTQVCLPTSEALQCLEASPHLSPWSARPSTPEYVVPSERSVGRCMGARVSTQGCDHAVTQDRLHGQATHCCLQGDWVGVSGVWVSLNGWLEVDFSPWSGSESRFIGP